VATLGIVEFVVFLIQKYYAGLDKSQKAVFADVHFMLFYCALFNALQSVLLAVTSYRVANRMWVRTEQLELDHYIEIREEFERVDAILYPHDQRAVPRSEFVFEFNMKGLAKLWERTYRFMRYPILSRRHADLLVQVRFHALRVHFLKANELPLQLKVSDYLKRSLLSVLQKLAHISAVAWLLLTGAIALVYFLMGIVIYVTNDLTKVGVSLTWIYLCSMIFFVILSLIIYNKMKWIFQRIMRMKLMQRNDFKQGMSIRKGEKDVQNQSDLFWGGNPNYITVIIQFAQFGFALALSILLVFWDDINVKNVPVSNWVYIVTVFACYAAFVAIMAQVIPRFTLCTNLGQLVNKKHLQETLGEFYLQEAERKRQQRLEEHDDDYIEMDNLDEASALSKDSPTEFGLADASIRTTVTSSSKGHDKTKLLADLVQTDTESLRFALPIDQSRRFAIDGDQSIRSANERRMRRKAVSDGVAMMRQMPIKPPRPSVPRARLERKKSNSASDAILEMKQGVDVESKPIRKSTSGPSLNTLSEDVPAVPRSSVPRSRLQRKKSLSASDAILKMKQGVDEVSDPIHKSTSGSSLNTLSRARFEAIHEHDDEEAPTSPVVSRSRRSNTPSSGSAPLPPLDETTGDGVEVAVTVDPLVGSMATLSNPEEPDSDDHSDIDDLPGAHGTEEKHDHRDEPETLDDVVRDYFRGPKYPVVSAVFGTLSCFWVVGQRIEELLLASGAMPDLKNTFQFPLIVSFWWEVGYLACFIAASSFVFVDFGCGRATSNRDRALSLAGFLDVVLSSACLVFLMIAEAQRCYCVEGDAKEDCCPQFGSRTYGGVGNIEPITSIIALRIFRFWIAKRIILFLDKYTKWSSKDAPPKNDHHHHGHGHHDHGHGHGDPRELAVDVWKGALGLYPEVVEEHGEFSAELLQTMLGVDTSINKPTKREVAASQVDDVSTVDAFVSADERSANKAGDSYVPKRVRHRQSLAAANNYTIAENKPVTQQSDLSVISAALSVDLTGEKITFVRPNAKVLRSMRRCDRKVLPLINTWSAVDLVMTKYEIVYFEAIDLVDPNKSKYSEYDIRAMEAGRQALEVTMGGKGMRLRDVAKGRKVVGHLAISAIDNVHVDRILPHEDKKQEEVACIVERHDEFWELTKETYNMKDGLTREARWAQLKEDRLMIHSDHGTLCFRFYTDLHDMETHRDRILGENEIEGKLHKDLALLWCQSIGRICKRAQLKQKLDHYGDGNDEELRDYLRVVDPKNDGNDGVMTKIHRRASSAVGLLPRPRLRRGNSLPSDVTASSPVARSKLSRGNTTGVSSAEVDEFVA